MVKHRFELSCTSAEFLVPEFLVPSCTRKGLINEYMQKECWNRQAQFFSGKDTNSDFSSSPFTILN